MPEIHPSSIVSCSSEDKDYPAANLLKSSAFKKWICAKPGEKSAVVEFQLPKMERISQIDIGNAGSAFIEILVRQSCNDSEDYQCLLVSSSFMSPLDVRSHTGLNRVRIFKLDKLSRTVQERKWDRIRVVCSQPFPPKAEAYGISFIRFYGPEDDSLKEKERPKDSVAGFNIAKDEEEEMDTDATSSSLFKKMQDSKHTKKNGDDVGDEPKATSSNIATQIRAASKIAEKEKEKEKASTSNKEAPPHIPKKEPTTKAKKEDQKKVNEMVVQDSSEDETPTDMGSIMRHVTFVLSGYQNPLRAQLRDAATEMGAKYRGDWGPACTHLICAFASTPKYKAVSGKGRIVTDKWITECKKQRKLLPWRDFRQGRAPSPPGSDSETRKRRRPRASTAHDADSNDEKIGTTSDEDSEEELRRRKKRRLNRKKKDDGDDDDDEWKPSRKDESSENEQEDEGDTEEDEESMDESEEEVMPKKIDRSKPKPKKPSKITEDSDDEVMPKTTATSIPKAQPVKEKAPVKKKAVILNGSDSDSDGGWAPIRRKKDGSSASNSPRKESPVKPTEDASRADIPVIFDSSFLLYGKFENGQERSLRRIIIGYGGSLEQYMHDKVKYVVTAMDWDDKFDDALMTNSSLIFVRPQWLIECDKRRQFLPFQKYQVVG